MNFTMKTLFPKVSVSILSLLHFRCNYYMCDYSYHFGYCIKSEGLLDIELLELLKKIPNLVPMYPLERSFFQGRILLMFIKLFFECKLKIKVFIFQDDFKTQFYFFEILCKFNFVPPVRTIIENCKQS